MKCNLCNREIPINRIKLSSRIKYCSVLCNKRAWYLRNKQTKNSLFDGNPDTGIRWEEWFINKYGATRPSRSLNTPIDFVWNNENIDLKVCELWKRSRKRGKQINRDKQAGVWSFNRNKIKDEIDFFICLALVNGKIHKSFKIPASEFPRSGISVGFNNSKYDKYLFNLPG